MSRSASADRLRGIETETAGEDAQAREHASAVPRRAGRSSSRARRAASAGARAGRAPAAEELEPLAEPREQRLRRQQLDARRGELDRERQPVEPHAELRDRRRVLVRHGEARRDGPRALERTAPPPRTATSASSGGSDRGSGKRERRDREGVLGGDAQRRAARHEHLHAGRGVEQIAHRARRVEQLLEVVEDEQHALAARGAREALPSSGRSPDSYSPSVCAIVGSSSAGSCTASSDTNQTPFGNSSTALRRRVEREARLARAARPGERHEADAVVGEQRLQRVELGSAADERRRLRGQVRRPVLERAERRELRLQPGRDELEQPLRLRQVLEAMLAEVARPRRRRGRASPARARPGRRAPPRRCGPRGARRGRRSRRRRSPAARVDAHPDAERQPVERSLAVPPRRRPRRPRGRTRRRASRPACRPRARRAKASRSRPRCSSSTAPYSSAPSSREQPRRLLDVGEEERHGAARAARPRPNSLSSAAGRARRPARRASSSAVLLLAAGSRGVEPRAGDLLDRDAAHVARDAAVARVVVVAGSGDRVAAVLRRARVDRASPRPFRRTASRRRRGSRTCRPQRARQSPRWIGIADRVGDVRRRTAGSRRARSSRRHDPRVPGPRLVVAVARPSCPGR